MRRLILLGIVLLALVAVFPVNPACFGPNREYSSCPAWTKGVDSHVTFQVLISFVFFAFAAIHYWIKLDYKKSIRKAKTMDDFKGDPATFQFLGSFLAFLEFVVVAAGLILSLVGALHSATWGYIGITAFAVMGLTIALQLKIPSEWKEIERQLGRGPPQFAPDPLCQDCSGEGIRRLVISGGFAQIIAYCDCRYKRKVIEERLSKGRFG